MVQQVSPPIDRPPPGHYRVRLMSVLSSLPVAGLPPPPQWRPHATHRVVVSSRRRRTGQLALPLEAGQAPLRERR
jgi:hypothetical protein